MADAALNPWCIAIGASGSDGLQDIQAILSGLPRALPAIVLIVLHRPWDQLSQLASVLRLSSHLPVRIARDGGRFEIGTVYLGEPDEHLKLAANTFGELVPDPDRQYRNRTVDLLFRSVAARGGRRIIGVVLSGALDDGARGLAAINQVGGLSMVVTPSKQLSQGMPENAINYDGPIDLIGNPTEIVQAIRIAVLQPEAAHSVPIS